MWILACEPTFPREPRNHSSIRRSNLLSVSSFKFTLSRRTRPSLSPCLYQQLRLQRLLCFTTLTASPRRGLRATDLLYGVGKVEKYDVTRTT
ncbi:hypothetical protein AGIG_G17489 [Arapaima gigas]